MFNEILLLIAHMAFTRVTTSSERGINKGPCDELYQSTMKTQAIVFLLLSASFMQTISPAPLLGGRISPPRLLNAFQGQVNALQEKVKNKISHFSNQPIYKLILEEADVDSQTVSQTEPNFALEFCLKTSYDQGSIQKAAERALALGKPVIALELLKSLFFSLRTDQNKINLILDLFSQEKFELLQFALPAAKIKNVAAVATPVHHNLSEAVFEQKFFAFSCLIKGFQAAYPLIAYDYLASEVIEPGTESVRVDGLFFWVFKQGLQSENKDPAVITQMLQEMAKVFVVPYDDFKDVLNYAHETENFDTFRSALSSLNKTIFRKESRTLQQNH